MSTVAIAKGSQNAFVSPPNSTGTPVTINSAVTLTATAGQTASGGTRTLNMVLRNAANPNGFSGSNTYSVAAVGGVQVINVSVTVTVPVGKYGTFAVVATSTVSFTDGPASGSGDTCVTVVENGKAASKLGITMDSVKTVRRHDLVNMDVEIRNNGQSDADLTVDVFPVVFRSERTPGKVASVAERWGFANHGDEIVAQAKRVIKSGGAETFPFSVLADGPIGSSSEHVFRITGNLDGEDIDVCVGTGYSIAQ